MPVEVALRYHELLPTGSLSCRPELPLFDAGLEVVPSDSPGNLGHHSSEGMMTDVPRGTNRRGGDQNILRDEVKASVWSPHECYLDPVAETDNREQADPPDPQHRGGLCSGFSFQMPKPFRDSEKGDSGR